LKKLMIYNYKPSDVQILPDLNIGPEAGDDPY
jgi:hypothetical protein